MENFFKNDGTEKWTHPTWWQAVLQTVVFVVVYEICAFVIGTLVELLLVAIADVPILSWLLSGVGETLLFTFTPIAIAFAVISIYLLLFKKYYINLISAIVIGMFLSFAVVSQLIEVIATNGLITWRTGNQIWFDIILCGLIFMFLFSRIDLKKYVANNNN